MAGMVPSGGQMSFADMAAQTRLPEQMVRRLLRHAMTMRVFRETEPGMVAHTRASKALAAPEMRDWLRVGTEEMWPSAVEVRIEVDSGSPGALTCRDHQCHDEMARVVGANRDCRFRLASSVSSLVSDSP